MICDGTGENGLAVLVDTRSRPDQVEGVVLRNWAVAKQALGIVEWSRTLRIALREADTAPWTAKQTAEAKEDVVCKLGRIGVKCVVLLQSPATPGIRQVHSAWNLLGHGGNPYKWAGTVERKPDWFVAPILHPHNYEAVYSWLISRWLRQALAVAQGKLLPLPWPHIHLHPEKSTFEVTADMAQKRLPIAVDIETDMAGTMITAIGLSNGEHTVSVPWDRYHIAGSEGEYEPSLTEYPWGRRIRGKVLEILETDVIEKILHNGAFDVLQLQQYDIRLLGFKWDTLLMHRVVYPQFRHGLQQACATEFAVEPWKCLFKPPKVKDQDEWLGDPIKLRTYNGCDTYATWQLWQHLKGKLG
jgi:hypothetical protein